MKSFRHAAAILALVSFSCVTNAAAQAVVINEFMAINRHGLLDQDGETSDWIEVYNPTASTVNLQNWYLSDDASDLRKWQFPAVAIPAAGYLLIFVSGKDRRTPAAQLHTNFQLDGDGEYLALVQP